MNQVHQGDNSWDLGAPPNWDNTVVPCLTLNVTERNGFLVSRWQPTEAEKKLIASGALVNLWVDADKSSHPVVGLSVGNEGEAQ